MMGRVVMEMEGVDLSTGEDGVIRLTVPAEATVTLYEAPGFSAPGGIKLRASGVELPVGLMEGDVYAGVPGGAYPVALVGLHLDPLPEPEAAHG